MTKNEAICKIRHPSLNYPKGERLYTPTYLIAGHYDVKGYVQPFRPIRVVYD